MASVLAVILNWNEIELTSQCVKSLNLQKNSACDILVVDNHSKKNPEKEIRNTFEKVCFIRNRKNLGVAGGRNIGIKYALEKNYAYVLLIDNDAYASEEMLHYLLKGMHRYTNCGIIGPKIYQKGKKNIIWRAGCTSWKLTYLHSIFIILRKFADNYNLPLPRLLDTVRGENKVDIGQYDKEESIDFQIGCVQLIRSKIFHDVGILDEEYCPYGSEDIDFCVRVKKKDWKILFAPKAICWHRVCGSFCESYNRTYHNAKNLVLLARKNIGPAYFWLLFIPDFIFIALPLMWFEIMLKGDKEKGKALLDAIKWHLSDIKRRGVLI